MSVETHEKLKSTKLAWEKARIAYNNAAEAYNLAYREHEVSLQPTEQIEHLNATR